MALKITPANVNEFGPGTTIRLDFGAMSADRDATVTRTEIVPASKFFDAQARVWAEYEDEDGNTAETAVTSFVDSDDTSPIGAYLIRPVPAATNNSPWAAA